MRKGFYILSGIVGLGIITSHAETNPTIISSKVARDSLGIGMWSSCEFANIGLTNGRNSEYGNSLFYPEMVIASWSAGFTPPLGIGLGARIWVADLYNAGWYWDGPWPVLALKASYTPFLNWQERRGELARYGRADVYVEAGSDWKGSTFLRSGISASVAPSRSLFPWSVELGISKPLGYGASIKPYVLFSSTFLGVEKPLKFRTLTADHIIRSAKPAKA